MISDELKEQIREKSRRLISAISELAKANGGEINEYGYIQKQPFGLDSLSSPAYLGVNFLREGVVPIIGVRSVEYNIDEVEKLSVILGKVINLIRQAEQKSGVTVQEILQLEEKLRNAERAALIEEAKRRAEEFAALPREELLWQKGNIQVMLKREGGEYDEKWGKIRGDVYLVVRKNGKENYYYPSYITESGAFKRKKFLERERWLFEDYTEEVAEFIKTWHQKIKTEKEKYLW